MSKYLLLFLIAAVSASNVIIVVPFVQAQEQVFDLETIRQGWQTRQDKIRSFRFSWRNCVTVPKGAFMDGKKDLKNPKGYVVPRETTIFNTDISSMSHHGNKSRSSSDSIGMTEDFKLVSQRGISVKTEARIKGFNPKGALSFPQGTLLPVDSNLKVELGPDTIPLFLTFRPFDPDIPFFKDFNKRFIVVPTRSFIENIPCIQIKEILNSTFMPITTVWVDPKRDFIIVRITVSIEQRIIDQITFHEFLHTKYCWVPKKWTRIHLRPGGEVGISTRSLVSEFQINEPIEDKEFELEFPAGTWVTDFTSGKEHRYIVLESGRKRPILDKELGAPYEQLLKTESGQALESSSRKKWFLLGIGVIAAFFIALVVFLRRRHFVNTPRI